MTLKEHKKHADLARPALGNFGRNEWAFVGAPCSTIKSLADAVIKALSPSYKCGYADAHHANVDDQYALPGRLSPGAVTEYTDQINYRRFDYNKSLNEYQFRQLFSDVDIIFVNGNHHEAKAQVVIIDEIKRASLQKRLSQLINVQMILLSDNATDVFDFIKEAVPQWQKLPVYRLGDTEKIIQFFKDKSGDTKPVLNGLVLAGGKSVRMGFDKGLLNLHGKEQRYYIGDILKNFCNDVFISCRPGQEKEIDSEYKKIIDSFTGLGPFGAILSAFRQQPDAAWLVVACDLPLLNIPTLRQLMAQRNTSGIATAYESPHDGFPEPLITIWEPKAYPVLLSFLSQGYSCPRKVLRNSDITMIKAVSPETLMNVNTPEDLEKAKQFLNLVDG